MKKQYIKPALYAEYFALCERISACDYVVRPTPRGQYDMNGTMMFGSDCGADSDLIWSIFGIDPNTVDLTDDYLAYLQMSGQCYNSFDNYQAMFTS